MPWHLTAVNHWTRAVETHSANHPSATHFCAAVDSLNPKDACPEGLDLLWASPECTHHSRARGGKPMNDQSRASAHCVTRWVEAHMPPVVQIENVPEFLTWGPLGANGKPIASRKGETFHAWVRMIESLGYRVEWRILCAADFGDPTTRERLFIQAVRGRRKIVWPEPSHRKRAGRDLFDGAKPTWRPARDVIDWSLEGKSIFSRKRPLKANTLRRIQEGLSRFGLKPSLVCMEHRGSVRSVDQPVPTVTTARGGAMGLIEPCLLPQQSDGRLRPISEPAPTVSTAGAIALVEPFLVEYYGTGGARSISEPLPTATTKPRFALVEPSLLPVVNVGGSSRRLDIRFRMLQPHELAAAQGFPPNYRFTGTKAEVCKQIGNAVPCGLARALVTAALTQRSNDA